MAKTINEEDIELKRAILKHEEGVDLIPGNIELSGLEVQLSNVLSRELILKEFVDSIREEYEYILIDCAPSLGMMTINALVAADEVIIPVQAAYLPVKGLQQLTKIPTIIREMTDDEAVINMVDANVQREELLPSEKAFAYRMKLDAMKRQAGRPGKNNVSQNETNLRSDEILAKEIGTSRNQIQRYIRLTELIPELLDMVDRKKLQFTVAVDISYIDPVVQQWLYEYIREKFYTD